MSHPNAPTEAPAEAMHIVADRTFDNHYDMTLTVGSSPKIGFNVCSRALARASKVFERMLYGTFMEQKPTTGDWVVDLPEDKAAVFEIMLGPIHGDFSKVPDDLEFGTIYDLFSAIHYYDMYATFQPWGSTWFRAASRSSVDIIPMLWVAWVYGSVQGIEKALLDLSKRIKSSEEHGDDCLLDGSLFELDHHLKEFDIKTHVTYNYFETLASLITAWENMRRSLMHVYDPDSNSLEQKLYQVCKSTDSPAGERDICENALLGSFTRGITARDWPIELLQSETMWHSSVEEVAEWMKDFQLEGVEGTWGAHAKCNPAITMHKEVDTIVSRITVSLLQPEHFKYLRGQRQKWGY
ncbi:hypothetical protein F4779DRAFT_618677 [Xylariaceae sp. FL0662B]|nr:hypothetical protein F4779DRAFT_618677 [Xylariaceae sp. FL0662B]